MKTRIFTDIRLHEVEWKDLLKLTPGEIFYELSLSFPWLISALLLAHFGWLLPALACSFLFFLTGLRQVHNAYHYALGISPKKTDYFIWLISILMLSSMHAVKYNHLQHHKNCMGEGDIEGMSARMKWWQVLLFGPLFPLILHANAIRHADASIRRWIWTELFSIALLVMVTFYLTDIYVLKYHVLVSVAGECMTAFFAVWTVHHDSDPAKVPGRTIRGRFRSLISYNMFYHAEHHLFPKVPTCHLPELAERLDKRLPEIQQMKVF